MASRRHEPPAPAWILVVAAIAQAYDAAFQQEAVQRLRSRVCMALETPPAATR